MDSRTKWAAAMCVTAWALGAGCAEKPAAAGGGVGEKPVLHIYTWTDYMKPEIVRRFEQEHNCAIVLDTYESNEAMYDKLKSRAGDDGAYDLLFPSSYMVKIMNDQGLLQKLNPEWIPNRQNIDSIYLGMACDPAMDHSVPYAVTVTCLGVLGSQVKDFAPSWALFDRTDLQGRMTMLDDSRETIGAALKFLGHSLNTTHDDELAQAKTVVLRWKKNLAKYDSHQYKHDLASGEFWLAHGYSGDLMLARAENPDIQIAVPQEGSALSFDDMVIPVDAAQVELAHQFINFILDPQVAAELTEYIYFLCPNEVSYQYLSPEIRANPILFPPPEVVANLEMIRDLGENNANYEKIWEEIKAEE